MSSKELELRQEHARLDDKLARLEREGASDSELLRVEKKQKEVHLELGKLL